MAKGNPLLEAMVIPVIEMLAKSGSDILFQKMVDQNKEKAAIVLATLQKSIQAVAKKNKIKLT